VNPNPLPQVSDLSPEASREAARRITWVGVGVNCTLTLLKFLAGFFGRSNALIADAIHSFSDLFTDAVVLFGLSVGRKGPDETHHFGHARIETLASAVVGLALVATALYLGVNAALDIHRHTERHPTLLALAGAALSIALKEALYHYTVRAGRRIRSDLVVANAWHHRSDALSSVVVFLGVGGAQLNPSWHILDAYAALLVSFFIVKVALDILRNALREFIDTAPSPEIVEEIRRCALGVEGVLDAHDFRVRSLGGQYQMEAHIVVDGGLSVIDGHRIAKEVERCLLDEVGNVDRAIIHVDPAVPRTQGGGSASS